VLHGRGDGGFDHGAVLERELAPHLRHALGVPDAEVLSLAVGFGLSFLVERAVILVAGRWGELDAAVGRADPFQLGRSGGQAEVDQPLLVGRGGHAGDGAHLGVGEPAGGELGSDQGQMLEGSTDSHVIAPGDQGQAAVPAQPVGRGSALPQHPGLAAVELGDEQQPDAVVSGAAAGHGTDLCLEPLGRQVSHRRWCRRERRVHCHLRRAQPGALNRRGPSSLRTGYDGLEVALRPRLATR
jgi:hypothetical protein